MIQNLEELERLLKILRSNGVYTFKWDKLELLITEQGPSLNPLDPTVNLDMPSQAELDAVVGMPVGGIEDPFLDYNTQQVVTDEDQ